MYVPGHPTPKFLVVHPLDVVREPGGYNMQIADTKNIPPRGNLSDYEVCLLYISLMSTTWQAFLQVHDS